MKTITLDRKFVYHQGKGTDVGQIVNVIIDQCLVTHIDGDNITLKLPMTEREEFIERARYVLALPTPCTLESELGDLYDDEARFND